jgi:hypothetical protein
LTRTEPSARLLGIIFARLFREFELQRADLEGVANLSIVEGRM